MTNISDNVLRNGHEVCLVGESLRRLYSSHVGVDQHGPDSLFPQRLQCLQLYVLLNPISSTCAPE